MAGLDNLSMDLAPSMIATNKLYLDPNNPRFYADDSPREPDDQIDAPGVQDALMQTAEAEFGLGPLMDSMEQNSYLPIDRIVVRPFKEDRYVVLEGNRRVAAVKFLLRRIEAGTLAVSDETLATLETLPALIYKGDDPDAAWVFQGIRHLSGVKDWPAYNKAHLLVTQVEKLDINQREAGKPFGLSSHAAGQYIRGYYAFQQAKRHQDYDDVVDTRAFPYFQELFGRSNIPLRNWLGWNEEESEFANDERFETFLDWLYPRGDQYGEDDDPDAPGHWDQRRIARAIDLRLVSDLIGNPDEFQGFLSGVSLHVAHARVDSRREAENRDADYYLGELRRIARTLEQLPSLQLKQSSQATEVAEQLAAIAGTAEAARQLVHE